MKKMNKQDRKQRQESQVLHLQQVKRLYEEAYSKHNTHGKYF
ncbi:hypothetical protein [Pseudalkalibacillus caeni]|nr:hypothetical protein [Pseudalkalibacillus caeni]